VERWFFEVGPFKGKHRKSSKFPHAKDSIKNIEKAKLYLTTMVSKNHRNVVFADEKPMKEIDIYGTVRRDPNTGEVPNWSCNANSKN